MWWKRGLKKPHNNLLIIKSQETYFVTKHIIFFISCKHLRTFQNCSGPLLWIVVFHLSENVFVSLDPIPESDFFHTPHPRWLIIDPRAKSESKMADREAREVVISTSSSARLLRWRVGPGSEVREGSVLCFYEIIGDGDRAGSFITQPKLKSAFTGIVRELLVAEGEIVAARWETVGQTRKGKVP